MSLRVLKALLWAPASLPAEGPRREAASAPFLISCSASSSVHQHTTACLQQATGHIAVYFWLKARVCACNTSVDS